MTHIVHSYNALSLPVLAMCKIRIRSKLLDLFSFVQLHCMKAEQIQTEVY